RFGRSWRRATASIDGSGSTPITRPSGTSAARRAVNSPLPLPRSTIVSSGDGACRSRNQASSVRWWPAVSAYAAPLQRADPRRSSRSPALVTGRLGARRQLLGRPRVPVRIAEVDERTPWLDVHGAGRDTAGCQLLAEERDVLDHHLEALLGPRWHVRD